MKASRLAILALIAVVLGAFAVPAAAQSKRDMAKARRLFKVGNKAFDAGRYSDALASYRASYKHYARPSTLFNIAVCRDRLGDLEGAYVDYASFVDKAEADDAALVTKARERIDELNQSLRLPVQVTSAPPGAAVYIDANTAIAGRTPVTLQLAPGSHTLRFEAPMHAPATKQAVVTPGVPTRVDAALQAFASVAIAATPADATIRLEGGDQTGTGRLTATVSAGTHVFVVQRDGYTTRRIEVAVATGQRVAREVTLDPYGPPPPVPAQPMTDDARAGGGLRGAGLTVGVVGVVLTAVAVQQGLSAQSSSDDAQAAAAQGRFDRDAFESAEAAESRMVLLYGVGGAALVTGAVLYYLGHRAGARAESPQLSVQPLAREPGGMVTFTGAF